VTCIRCSQIDVSPIVSLFAWLFLISFNLFFPETAIRNGLDVVVGTPGRILDYVRKGTLDFSKLKYVILDEVDQMLDMGFADNVEEILKSAYDRGWFYKSF
jgi:hypothetical protein